MRGSVYRRGATWTWHVKWHQAGEARQRKRGGYRTRKEAEEALRKYLRTVDLGEAVRSEEMTLSAFLTSWVDHLEHVVERKASTVASYRSSLARYVEPTIGGLRLQQVTAADLDGLYRRMATAGQAARTIRLLHSILRAALGHAERLGLVERNVAVRATPPSTRAAKAPELAVWNVDQLGAFLDSIDDKPQAEAITFAAFTGCRRGEVVALQWSDVDLDEGEVTIRRSYVMAGRQLVETTPKSHQERRVALDPSLVALLRRHRAAQHEWRLVMGAGWRDLDLVFPAPDGRHLRPETLSQAFKRYVAASGLPRVRFHDLRHGHATAMVEQGFDAKTVSTRLGHATVGFTLDRYVKPSTERQAAAAVGFAEAVEAARSRSRSATRRLPTS
jgi:integrase